MGVPNAMATPKAAPGTQEPPRRPRDEGGSRWLGALRPLLPSCRLCPTLQKIPRARGHSQGPRGTLHLPDGCSRPQCRSLSSQRKGSLRQAAPVGKSVECAGTSHSIHHCPRRRSSQPALPSRELATAQYSWPGVPEPSREGPLVSVGACWTGCAPSRPAVASAGHELGGSPGP